MADQHNIPPPTYSQGVLNPTDDVRPHLATPTEPQILIAPSVDSVNFQKGYLGAEEERAAIEGELQIKDAEPGRWDKVTVSLQTLEAAYGREIELALSEIILYNQQDDERSSMPSSFLFSIPLMPDTPQSFQTSFSSLKHVLKATLRPNDSSVLPVTRALHVHTKRYTSHSYSIPVAPSTHRVNLPTHCEVEIPRATFTAGEAIPIYVTVPSPNRELVVEQGLRLRNIRVELVRIVQVAKDEELPLSDLDSVFEEQSQVVSPYPPRAEPSSTKPSALERDIPPSSSSKEPVSPSSSFATFKEVLARSGASCRFHSSRPVKLRFVLHQPSPSGSPLDNSLALSNGEHRLLEHDAECASISQRTLLHSISFRIHVHISFVNVMTRSEQISLVAIPVVILPPPAPLPEVPQTIDAAYQKKHDRPPAKTNRHEDVDPFIPHYTEGEAGPSALPNGAPPPFEDAPPPFFPSASEPSTSNRLPTFFEAEHEIIVPSHEQQDYATLASFSPIFAGEGILFGFPSSQQFDGHDDLQRLATPPPSLEMATRDTDLTSLAEIREPDRALEALGLVLEQHEESIGVEQPPPPPAMDDPSDPPPLIDSDFRSLDAPTQGSPPRSSSSSHLPYIMNEPPGLQTPPPPAQSIIPEARSGDGNAPPPYLIPEPHPDVVHVIRPPPYMD
ncbi:hypothetical protein AX16_005517 [Volvariella volvacea WC 439]|nr:hypothetical protein AX16_005517 [Volvariella volvacea WC 439]